MSHNSDDYPDDLFIEVSPPAVDQQALAQAAGVRHARRVREAARPPEGATHRCVNCGRWASDDHECVILRVESGPGQYARAAELLEELTQAGRRPDPGDVLPSREIGH